MNYKEKFSDEEWLVFVSLPTLLIAMLGSVDKIKLSEDKSRKFGESVHRCFSDLNRFDSDLMKFILTEMPNESQAIHAYVFKPRFDYQSEILKLNALLNRKISDKEKSDFTNDILQIIIDIYRGLELKEGELEELLSKSDIINVFANILKD